MSDLGPFVWTAQHLRRLHNMSTGSGLSPHTNDHTSRYLETFMTPYHWGGKMSAAKPLPPILQPLLQWSNRQLPIFCPAEQPQARFNQVCFPAWCKATLNGSIMIMLLPAIAMAAGSFCAT